MTVTVTALKRAVEEAAADDSLAYEGLQGFAISDMFGYIAENPTALTILANRLSDRGEAGNAASKANLADIQNVVDNMSPSDPRKAALEWAIDLLTPPELATNPVLDPFRIQAKGENGEPRTWSRDTREGITALLRNVRRLDPDAKAYQWDNVEWRELDL